MTPAYMSRQNVLLLSKSYMNNIYPRFPVRLMLFLLWILIVGSRRRRFQNTFRSFQISLNIAHWVYRDEIKEQLDFDEHLSRPGLASNAIFFHCSPFNGQNSQNCWRWVFLFFIGLKCLKNEKFSSGFPSFSCNARSKKKFEMEIWEENFVNFHEREQTFHLQKILKIALLLLLASKCKPCIFLELLRSNGLYRYLISYYQRCDHAAIISFYQEIQDNVPLAERHKSYNCSVLIQLLSN
jgi:hypothetical protein